MAWSCGVAVPAMSNSSLSVRVDHTRQDAQQRRLTSRLAPAEDDLCVRGNDAVEAVDVQRRAGVVAEVQILDGYHVLSLFAADKEPWLCAWY